MIRNLLFALALAVLTVRPAHGEPPRVATSTAPTAPGSGPGAARLELELDELESPPEMPPIWARGWFWGLTSAVVVAVVIGSVVAARAGPRCFCVTPAGTPCDTCD